MNPVPAIREDGSVQRTDVELTSAIAGALAEKILAGETIYPEVGALELVYKDEEGMNHAIDVRVNTLHSWVRRGTVIPGDGRRLRDVLDEARVEKKRAERDLRQTNIIENAEIALAELVNIPITSGKMVTTKFKANKKGFKAYGKVETEFEGVNPKLAEAKIKALSFGLERLEPTRYGARLSTTNSHMIFNLADLRRAKEKRDEMEAQLV